MIMRKLAVALLASTALTTVAHGQTAQQVPAADQNAAAPSTAQPASAAQTPPAAAAKKPSDFGTVYGKAPDDTKPKPAPVKPEVTQAKEPAPRKVKSQAKLATPAAATGTAAPSSDAPAASAGTSDTGLPLSSSKAIGTNAPAKSAPALAPAQQSLDSFQPGSVVSDKAIRDIALPVGDYNEAGKFTPGFYSSNANGPLGDSKSGWRGFKDGQFNVTFDGIPFGDVNNPSHHSAAYFPGLFLGQIVIDRGPGSASQIGYATFGGTMALMSRELKDKAATEIEGSIGNYGTYSGGVTQQTGLINGDTRAMIQYSYQKTDGALNYGHVDVNNVLFKLDKKLNDDWKLTLFGTTGYENYNQVSAPSFAQLQAFGRKFGQVNGDPTSQSYVPYTTSEKRTDMLYAQLQGKLGYGISIDNKVYTYAYDYPDFQHNPQDGSIIGPSSNANGGTLGLATNTVVGGKVVTVGKTPLSVTNPVGTCFIKGTTISTGKTCTTTITLSGVNDGDITGYRQLNNYRGYGNTLDVKRDIDSGIASGQFRAGLWLERVDNHRWQKYYDNTQGRYLDTFPATVQNSLAGTTAVDISPAQAAIDKNNALYKLNLDSSLTNIQFYFEYEWKPMAGLSITPGIKKESITRDHVAVVNQTTLLPAHFSRTYDATLPFISISQKLNSEWTVYGQASNGFLIPNVSSFYVTDSSFAQNQDLPETTVNMQAGVVYKSNQLTMGVDVYRILAKNAATTTTGSDGTQIYISNQNVTREGVEAQATYAFGNGLALFGSAALMEATITNGASNGLDYANTPKYTAAGGPVYDDGKFFGSVLYKIVGDQYGSGGQFASTATVNGELNHVGSYNSTDAVVGMRFDTKTALGIGEKAEVKLGVQNIFDNHNIVDIGGTPKTLTAADAKNTLSYTSQAGRIIYLGGKLNF